jgi:N6-L-threonylcarbamoyladenine synthase
VLVTKALAACRDLGIPRLLLGGGVAANARVRELTAERSAEAGVQLHIPPLSLCTDNGAMIAVLGAQLVAAGHAPSPADFAADSTLPMTQAQLTESSSLTI